MKEEAGTGSQESVGGSLRDRWIETATEPGLVF